MLHWMPLSEMMEAPDTTEHKQFILLRVNTKESFTYLFACKTGQTTMNRPNNSEQAKQQWKGCKHVPHGQTKNHLFIQHCIPCHAWNYPHLTYLSIITVKKHQQDKSFGTFSVTSKMNMLLNSIMCCITSNHIRLCKYLIFPKTDALLVQLCHTVCNSETVSSHAIVLQYNWCMWYVTQTIVPWSKHEATQHVLSTLCLTSYSRCEARKGYQSG